MKKILSALLLVIGVNAYAHCRHDCYDDGRYVERYVERPYSQTHEHGSEHHTQGYDERTGAHWKQTSFGNTTYGQDSKGNRWTCTTYSDGRSYCR